MKTALSEEGEWGWDNNSSKKRNIGRLLVRNEFFSLAIVCMFAAAGMFLSACNLVEPTLDHVAIPGGAETTIVVTPTNARIPSSNKTAPRNTLFLDETPEESEKTSLATREPLNSDQTPGSADVQTISESPDGKWTAIMVRSAVVSAMQVYQSESSWKRWVIPGSVDSGIRQVPWPHKWSRDGNYLYYTHQFRNGDGCLGYWAFNGGDLYRLNLISGETMMIAPRIGYWISLSPEETRLAYLDSGKIGIRNLPEGTQNEVQVINIFEGSIPTWPMDIIWAPDGNSLIFGIVGNVCVSEDSYSLVLLDVVSMQQEVISFDLKEWLQPVKWEEGNVWLMDLEGVYWLLNPAEQTIVKMR